MSSARLRLERLERLRRAVTGASPDPMLCACFVREHNYRYALAWLAPDEATREAVAAERRTARCRTCGKLLYGAWQSGIRIEAIDLSTPMDGVPVIRQRLEDAS